MGANGADDKMAIKKFQLELTRFIDYVKSRFDLSRIDHCYILGEGELNSVIKKHMMDHEKCIAYVYNPLGSNINVDPSVSEGLLERGSAFAPLVGVAIDRGQTVHLSSSRARSGSGVLRQNLVFLTLLVLLLLNFILANKLIDTKLNKLNGTITKLQHDVSFLESRYKYRDTILAELKNVEQRRAGLSSNLDILANKADSYDWKFIFNNVAASFPANIALTSWSIDFANAGGSIVQPGIRFKGIIRQTETEKLAALNKLFYKLSTSPAFNSVTIRSVSKDKTINKSLDTMTFEILANLEHSPLKMASSADAPSAFTH